MLPELRKRVPKAFGTYHEPFLGGGALFFDLQPASATLSDFNERLVRSYRAIRDQPEELIQLLGSYPHTKERFLELRQTDIDSASDVELAAWMIYLNRTGFNGLYRVNSKNQFNVPFGRYKSPTICDADNLRACSQALKGVKLGHGSFESVLRRAKAGDFVYFDPPYVPLNATSFTSYTAKDFGPAEQIRLRDVALELKGNGVHVLLSNSSAPLVRELYQEDFKIKKVLATRSVNSVASKRGQIHEFLMW